MSPAKATCADCHESEEGPLDEVGEWAEEHERDEPGHVVDIERVADGLGASEHVTREAREYVRALDEAGKLVGRKRRGAIAAALYEAGDALWNQKPVADAAGVCVVTLRERLRDLEEVLA